jgi:anaphase-promoting complex subunit 3
MENYLYECVRSSLRGYLYKNATFLCERLCAEFPSESNVHLLATCYFRSNQAHRAYHVLKGTKSRQCRYLFALACMQMECLEEAEAALVGSLEPSGEGAVPGAGSAGSCYLLGVICRQSDRRQAAIGYYTQALSLDPFLWSAYEDLCGLGAEEEAAPVYSDLASFQLQKFELIAQSSGAQSEHEEHEFSLRTPVSSNGSPKHRRLHSGGAVSDAGSGFLTPASENLVTPGPVQNLPGLGPPPGPGRNNPTASPAGVGSGDGVGRGTSGYAQQRRKFVDPDGKFRKSLRSLSMRPGYTQIPGRLFEQGPRRSTRLNSGVEYNSGAVPSTTTAAAPIVGSAANAGGGAVATIRGGGAGATPGSRTARKQAVGISVDDGRKLFDSFEVCGSGDEGLSKDSGVDDESQLSGPLARGALELFSLLRILGEGYRHLCMLRCHEAVQSFSKLPQQHFATAWVLCQVGRAYLEMVNYPEAERVYSWARRVSPHCSEGMDMYSTALYHMKKDVQLSYLAQDAVAMDRLSPQAWCVMGNCFSLQKDHETALKFFQRALQLDPHFTYAHTLCGHEYVAMEDFEEGLICYRKAIRLDSRHYNAWYGLGTIYFRQEKYELAEYHFRRALYVNSRSSVLHCYLGMALHALKKNGEALALLEQAIVADPKNPLPKFQRANVLMSEGRYHEALAELEELKELAPRESSVFFLMGRIYKRLDMLERAIHHFCIALDLKPSTTDVNLIKTAIEKLPIADDLEVENL